MDSGADQYELTVDLERGVLLRCAALLESTAFEISEITDVVFDEEIDPALFRLQPPPAEKRRQVPHPSRAPCSFCGKAGHEVDHLVAGPTIYICNECIDVSAEITSRLATDS